MEHMLQKEIMRALSVARGPSETSKGLRRFGSRQWMSCLPWLRQSTLELLLIETLKSSGCEHVVPAAVRCLMEQDASCNQERFMAMTGEFGFLVGQLEESEVPYAVLKGFSLVPDFCPSPELRSQYDFDFLIGRESLLRADAVLRSAGFVRKHSDRVANPAVYYHPERKPHPPSTLAGIFSSELHRSVEVHTSIWKSGTEGVGVEWPGDAMRRSFRKNWEGLNFPVLATEDALLFQVLHIFRHILNNWCRLSWFHEIAVFLKRRSGDESFWITFGQLVRGQKRLCQCVGIVFALAARLFEAETPGAIRPFSTDTLTPSMGLWVERYGIRSAIQNFGGDKFSLLLHELFVDDPKLWLQLRSRRLFPRNRPHKVVRMDRRHGREVWRARSQQAVHSFRRLGFHILAGLKYMLALPSWAVEKQRLSRNDRMRTRNQNVWASTVRMARERAVDAGKADV